MTATEVTELDAAAHTIKNVTIYKAGKADIVRTFSVDLEVGQNTIEISHLSNSLDKQSVRVSGIGGAASLSDIVTTVGAVGDGGPNENTILQKALENNAKHLTAQQGILVEELELLRNYSKALEPTIVPIEEMFQFLEIFREKQMNSLKAILEFEKPIEEANRALEKAKKNIFTAAGQRNAESKVVVRIHAKESCRITLQLRYVVKDASWKPIYDIYASTNNSKSVQMNYRATVNQRTGEDWSGAELTLTTASASLNIIPKLPTYEITEKMPGGFVTNGSRPPMPVSGGLFGNTPATALFGSAAFGQAFPSQAQNPPPGSALFGASTTQATPQTQTQQGDSAQTQPQRSRGLFGQTQQAQPAGFTPIQPSSSSFTTASGQTSDSQAPVSLTENTATIRTNTISESYVVQGTASVPSDGQDHIVSISSFEAETDITRVAVPRLRADVFLQCKIKNTSKYRLLDGVVRVFLDDDYVSTVTIPGTKIGESFECTLGLDPFINVSYERTSKSIVEEARMFGALSTRTTKHTTRITVKNTHPNPVDVILKDGLPLGNEFKDWKVVLRQPSGLSDAIECEEITVKEPDAGKSKRKVRWSKLDNGRSGESEGKYEWVLNVAAGAEVAMDAEWDIKTAKSDFWEEIIRS